MYARAVTPVEFVCVFTIAVNIPRSYDLNVRRELLAERTMGRRISATLLCDGRGVLSRWFLDK